MKGFITFIFLAFLNGIYIEFISNPKRNPKNFYFSFCYHQGNIFFSNFHRKDFQNKFQNFLSHLILYGPQLTDTLKSDYHHVDEIHKILGNHFDHKLFKFYRKQPNFSLHDHSNLQNLDSFRPKGIPYFSFFPRLGTQLPTIFFISLHFKHS